MFTCTASSIVGYVLQCKFGSCVCVPWRKDAVTTVKVTGVTCVGVLPCSAQRKSCTSLDVSPTSIVDASVTRGRYVCIGWSVTTLSPILRQIYVSVLC